MAPSQRSLVPLILASIYATILTIATALGLFLLAGILAIGDPIGPAAAELKARAQATADVILYVDLAFFLLSLASIALFAAGKRWARHFLFALVIIASLVLPLTAALLSPWLIAVVIPLAAIDGLLAWYFYRAPHSSSTPA